MERFCHKCGSLVSGTGAFCPLCGEAMDVLPGGSVNLSKPVENDVMPTGNGNVSMPATAPMGAPVAPAAAPVSTPVGGYNPAPASAPMGGYNNAAYPQAAPVVYNNITSTPAGKHMTTGQWVLTIFLSGLGLIGLILMFVWAFGDNEYPDKKTYAKAMLIWYLVAVGITVLAFVLTIVLGIGVVGSLGDYYY